MQDSFSGYNAWYCYDAVYTLALALNKTIAGKTNSGSENKYFPFV